MFQLVQSSQYNSGLNKRLHLRGSAACWWGRSLQAQCAVTQCKDKGHKHAARKWKQDQFRIFWSKTLFYIKHTVQMFPLHNIQLHGEGREAAFLPQSSFDMTTPVRTRCSGSLKGPYGKAVRKNGLGLFRAQWHVCVMRARWGCSIPLTFAEQPLVPRMWHAWVWLYTPDMWWDAQCAAKVLLAHSAARAPGATHWLREAESDILTHLDLSSSPRWYLEMSQSHCSCSTRQIRDSLCIAGTGFRQQVSPAGREHIACLQGDRSFCCGSHEIKKCFFFSRTCWF